MITQWLSMCCASLVFCFLHPLYNKYTILPKNVFICNQLHTFWEQLNEWCCKGMSLCLSVVFFCCSEGRFFDWKEEKFWLEILWSSFNIVFWPLEGSISLPVMLMVDKHLLHIAFQASSLHTTKGKNPIEYSFW